MKVIFKDRLLVLVPESDGEKLDVGIWLAAHDDHVLHVRASGDEYDGGFVAHDLGPRDEACREPINVVSNSRDPACRLISNFAETPFTLDGAGYRSVESFWQGLKFERAADRRRLAEASGGEARSRGEAQGYGEKLAYGGAEIVVGTFAHWQLMERACRAKFEQHGEARAALLGTGQRPLEHRVRRDSRTIPGAIMAEIWMRIRKDLAAGSA